MAYLLAFKMGGVCIMSYTLKHLFFKPKNINYAIQETKRNCDEILENSEKRLDYFYRDISDEILLKRLNERLMEYQGSQNNYFEGICVIVGFISIIFQINLFPQLWDYENISSLRFFLINMFVAPVCVYMYFLKKKDEKSLLNECSSIYSVLKKREVI